MSDWGNTAYIRTTDVDSVARALSELLAEAGARAIQKPQPREPMQRDPMIYGGMRTCPLWGIAVLPGSEGWTSLQTAPLHLLCERLPGSERPLLSTLSVKLGCDSFQFNLYGGADAVMVECLPDGRIFVSGAVPRAKDPTLFHEEKIGEGDFEARFRLITDLPSDVHYAVSWSSTYSEVAAGIGGSLGGQFREIWRNIVNYQVLVPHRDLPIDAARALYFDARAVARPAMPAGAPPPTRSQETRPVTAGGSGEIGPVPPPTHVDLPAVGAEAAPSSASSPTSRPISVPGGPSLPAAPAPTAKPITMPRPARTIPPATGAGGTLAGAGSIAAAARAIVAGDKPGASPEAKVPGGTGPSVPPSGGRAPSPLPPPPVTPQADETAVQSPTPDALPAPQESASGPVSADGWDEPGAAKSS